MRYHVPGLQFLQLDLYFESWQEEFYRTDQQNLPWLIEYFKFIVQFHTPPKGRLQAWEGKLQKRNYAIGDNAATLQLHIRKALGVTSNYSLIVSSD